MATGDAETPAPYKQQVKQNITNAQNNTGSNFETFSKMVNEGNPFATTKGLNSKAKSEVDAAKANKEEYRKTPEANAPLQNATLADFKDGLAEKLYNDNSGDLGMEMKSFILDDFHDNAVDMLLSNSPRLKQYMENLSQATLNNPKAYLGNKDFIEEAMKGYNLSANEIDLLRKLSLRQTTLAVPTKSGYVRAGKENRENKVYQDMFKEEIEKRPETKQLSELNKAKSAAINRQDVTASVLTGQGKGGIMGMHFPWMELNPEMNPTIFGNKALRGRNIANQIIGGVAAFKLNPHEEENEANAVIAEMVNDARKLGMIREDEIRNYVATRLAGATPKGKVVAVSNQRKEDR